MKHVVVTTNRARRGVFSGKLESNDGKGNVVLQDARMCVRWVGTRGVLGLAATGPTSESRISKAVPRIELDGVTSVIDMTNEAVERWELEPWG